MVLRALPALCCRQGASVYEEPVKDDDISNRGELEGGVKF
jgi:hypothetical protein